MANRTFFPVKTTEIEDIIVAGSFKPNGSSAIDNTANTGKGFTVARTTNGVFTVTLTDKYAECVSATVSLALNSVADTFLQLGAIDVVSAKTIVIKSLTTVYTDVASPDPDTYATTATDIAAHANNRIHFCLILRNSKVP